jgi:endonuclease/exonuclease/phosphatase family metal-dependent hydrolase
MTMLVLKTRLDRLLALLAGAVVLTAFLGGCAGVVVAFQPFGHRGWVFAMVVALLAGWLIRRSPTRRLPLPLPAQTAVALVLACWLVLIAWSAASPGGPMPAPKADADAAAIRVLTWNILVGAESGPPWSRHGWPVRKHALGSVLRAARPDILCVQEALEGQVKFLEATLPRHRRVGAGRDDGRSAGEHCAIYFDGDRFEPIEEGTFWLEEPADEPPGRFTLGPKRICTWVRLRDRTSTSTSTSTSGRTLRLYNTHTYLTERARLRAARIILGRIALGDPTDAVLVVGDFNASPAAPSRRIFAAAALTSVAELAGGSAPAPTYQFYGIRLKSLDDIFLSRDFQVRRHRVVDVKVGNTFPSDHFGILADVSL